MESRRTRLTEGSVGRHLVNMTLPVLLGIATMMGQAFVDAWFLGRVGDHALAAHAFGFPVWMIITSVAIGLGAGTSSVVARAIGAGDEQRAQRLTTDSVLLSFTITAALSLLGVLTIDPLFRLLGAPEDMISLIRGFMTILYAGIPFVVVGMVGMASMRATGDTRLPSKLMIIGSILNVALDPVLIFGFGPVPAMGLNGAAMAALLAGLVRERGDGTCVVFLPADLAEGESDTWWPVSASLRAAVASCFSDADLAAVNVRLRDYEAAVSDGGGHPVRRRACRVGPPRR